MKYKGRNLRLSSFDRVGLKKPVITFTSSMMIVLTSIGDRLQILLLMSGKFKRVN